MSIERIVLMAGIAGLLAGILAAIIHPGLRRRMRETIRLLPQATRGERIMLCAGIGLLAVGPLLIGPLDEILALALIGRVTRRIVGRSQP